MEFRLVSDTGYDPQGFLSRDALLKLPVLSRMQIQRNGITGTWKFSEICGFV
jgi:hypothetical protein